MMSRLALVAVVALAAVAAVQAQSKDVTPSKADFKGTLKKQGFNLAADVFDIANITAPLNNKAAVYTVLVPNDKAVETFLSRMNLKPEDLKKRPMLAKQIAAAHIIPKHNVRQQELFQNGNTRVVATVAGKPNNLVFRKVGDGVKVTDVQGNTANVKAHFAIDDVKTAHPVDKVLLPDTVYYDFVTLCRFRQLTISEFCDSLVYSDLNGTVNDAAFEKTVFVPNNQAFVKLAKANGLDLTAGQAPPPTKVADTLKHHVVDGARELPGGFKAGQQVTTLQGQPLVLELEAVKPPAGDIRTLPYARATVRSTGGDKATVVKPNVHVGRSVVQGVDAVLTPGAATTKPAPAPAAASKPAAAGGRRHLLGFGWGMMGGPTAEMDDAMSDINAAANGDESVAAAADQSLLGAEELSVPGDYNQVDNGINPW